MEDCSFFQKVGTLQWWQKKLFEIEAFADGVLLLFGPSVL